MQTPTAGQWAADPYRLHELRYWDGTRWTEHVADAGRQSIDPPPAAVTPQVTRSTRDIPETPSFAEATQDPGHRDHAVRPSGFSSKTHILLTLFSCGLWLLIAPAIYLWRRGSRLLAGAWAAGAAILLIIAAANADTTPPTSDTVAASQAQAAVPTDQSSIRPLVGAQTATAPAPATTTPAVRTSTTAATTTPKKKTTSTTSKPKPTTSSTTPKPKPTTTSAKHYANCTAMHADYPHGVGRTGAHDKTSGTPVTTFTVSSTLYAANSGSDRDGDGIACEKA